MSIHSLNSGRMKFFWPEFVPSTETDPFFEPTRRAILATLKGSPVLESFCEHFNTPSKLNFVEERFSDQSGEPFCLSEQTRSTYLSPNYPRHLKDVLCGLGVEEMSDEKFVEHFEQAISEDEKGFRDKSDDWHSELAGALLPLTENETLKEALRRLPIVPLSNGQWVPAESKPRMFDEQSMLGDIQVLESLRTIHVSALEKGTRRNLWSSLGIHPISRQEICQYIVDAHQNPVIDPMVWTRAQLVAHAEFLYYSEWRPSSAVELWVETTREQRVRSTRAYYITDDAWDEPTMRVFKAMRSAFSVILHDDYFSCHGAVETEMESVSERTIGDSDEGVSQNTTHNSGGISNMQSVRSSVSGDDDDSQMHASKLEAHIQSEPEETSEESERDSDTSSSEGIYYLDDIGDMACVEYPISEAGFAEFLKWQSLKREWDQLLQQCNRHDETNATKNKDQWLSFLKDVLQVATLPRLAQTSPSEKDRGSLTLNNDMRWLLRSCDVSDVLHVLVTNWHHYAHLIEAQGTSCQNEGRLQELRDTLWPKEPEAESLSHSRSNQANTNLNEALRTAAVITNVGRTCLERCVLRNIDPRFDEDPDIRLGRLDLKDISKDERQRLKSLMISVESDALYYLKCLYSLSEKSSPNHTTVKRLYEEVQSRYDQDTALIR